MPPFGLFGSQRERSSAHRPTQAQPGLVDSIAYLFRANDAIRIVSNGGLDHIEEQSLTPSNRSFSSSRRSLRRAARAKSKLGRANKHIRTRPQKNHAKKHLSLGLKCLVCGSSFTGTTCKLCSTAYVFDAPLCTPPRSPIAFELLNDISKAQDHCLLEAVVLSAFSDINTVVATFGLENSVDETQLAKFYEILSASSSTAPMRAVLNGAQSVFNSRPVYEMSNEELVYVVSLLHCPVFAECSMFTKIMGPMQQLSRYSSMRSTARVVLEQIAGRISQASAEIQNAFADSLKLLPNIALQSLVSLINAYISYRLVFLYSHRSVPSLAQASKSCPISSTSSVAVGSSSLSCTTIISREWYSDDWRLGAFVTLQSLFHQTSTRLNLLDPRLFYNIALDKVDLVSDWISNITGSKHHGIKPVFFTKYPFMIPMGSKQTLLKHFMDKERSRIYQLFANEPPPPPVRVVVSQPATRAPQVETYMPPPATILCVRVRRSKILRDSLAIIKPLEDIELRKALRVEFASEPGIDAGGLRKEWLLLLFRQLFDKTNAVFIEDETSNLGWFGNADLCYYTLAGICLAFAFRDSAMIDINFPTMLFKKLVKEPVTLKDVTQLWPHEGGSLQSLLDYTSDDFESVFGLDFSAPDGTLLVPNGDSVPVTLANRAEYVDLMVKHLSRSTPEYFAFETGFQRVIGTSVINIFSHFELECLLYGDLEPIDVAKLRRVAVYVGWKTQKPEKVKVIEWFWDLFASLDAETQRKLLVFVTATDKIPAAGIESMGFRLLCLGGDSDRLPQAHTCYQQLGLHRYNSRDKLKAKLMQAITECQGFGLK